MVSRRRGYELFRRLLGRRAADVWVFFVRESETLLYPGSHPIRLMAGAAIPLANDGQIELVSGLHGFPDRRGQIKQGA